MPSVSIRRLMSIFAFAVTAGLLFGIGAQKLIFEDLRVGGPVYGGIVDGKDLVADILPPPLFVVESYMLANEMHLDPSLRAENQGRIVELQKAFNERRDFWAQKALPNELATGLLEVERKADAFWQVMNMEFLPAAQAGKTEQMEEALTKLRAAFRSHRDQVLLLADNANKWLSESETSATRSGEHMGVVALAVSGFSVAFFLAGLWLVRRRAIVPLLTLSEQMRSLAVGNLDLRVSFLKRNDEIGTIASSVEVFRQAGIEREQMQQEIDARRRENEQYLAEQAQIQAEEASALKDVTDQLGASLQRLTGYDLGCQISNSFEQRFEPLRQDFNQSVSTFRSTLAEVLASVSHLEERASSMRDVANQLSKRTEQQAAAVEQTSASLEEVVSTMQVSTAQAEETRALVLDARGSAQSTARVVEDAIQAMRRIEEASGQIGQIINLIDQIAFQTNLLALNAGVEAARAGDAGKGFAVVAQEVRDLAQRSAAAAKEIAGLIRNSSEEVSCGVRLVDEVGAALAHINEFVAQIDTRVDAITGASREQSLGLKEISSAVGSIDQMTQQNAVMVEESSAVSQALAEDAKQLFALVSRFKLSGNDTRSTGVAVPRSAVAA